MTYNNLLDLMLELEMTLRARHIHSADMPEHELCEELAGEMRRYEDRLRELMAAYGRGDDASTEVDTVSWQRRPSAEHVIELMSEFAEMCDDAYDEDYHNAAFDRAVEDLTTQMTSTFTHALYRYRLLRGDLVRAGAKLSFDGSTLSINSALTTATSWSFGENFRISSDGTLYAKAVRLSGDEPNCYADADRDWQKSRLNVTFVSSANSSKDDTADNAGA